MQEYITVSILNSYISGLIDRDELLQEFWLKGELSGFRHYQQSGHSYFSLKDADSTISCVMFKSRIQKMRFRPEDGMEVLLRGYVSVYARQGKYQVYVEDMQPFGTGSLFLYLEKLKSRLTQEGYFDLDRKKDIPRMVNRVGVVTSQDGAALQDILRVIKLRHPGAAVILAHSSVQGSDAPRELAQGVQMLNDYGLADVIIVARGGGSLEDLMAFNSEELVQAIYDSAIPVISGVGHEVDVTLCDLAADLRAATPTQAAQFAVPDYGALEKSLTNLNARLIRCMQRQLNNRTERLDRNLMKKVWREPQLLIEKQNDRLMLLEQGMGTAMLNKYKESSHRFELAAQALDKVSPLKILNRGYAILTRNGTIVSKIAEVVEGDDMDIDLIDGRLRVLIQGKEKINRWRI